MTEQGNHVTGAGSGEGEGKPARRRRGLRVVLWIAAILVALAAIVAALVPMIFTDERVKGIVAAQASKALNRPVSIGTFHFTFSGDVQIGDLRVANLKGFSDQPFVELKGAEGSISVWSLITSLGKSVHVQLVVTDPLVLIERNAQGRLNIEDLLKPKEEKETPPTPLHELSLAVQVRGGKLVLQDNSGEKPRRTEIRNLDADAQLPALDQPLSYRVSGNAAGGSFEFTGKPRLFHGGLVDPRHIEGELLKATVSQFPLDAVLEVAGLPPIATTASADLVVNAQSAGQFTARGSLSARQPGRTDQISLNLTDCQIDLGKADAIAKVSFEVQPFGKATLDVNVKNAGQDALKAVVTFNGDLSKLPAHLAKALRMPLTAEGQPAVTRGDIKGSLEVTGPLPDVTGKLALTVKDFQAAPSFTGGKELPPEDAGITAEAKLLFTPEGRLNELLIPNLRAESSFLDARLANGRVSSLADLTKLGTDVEGYVKFSGRAFSTKFGKALGLPELHDKLDLTFSGKGEAGRAALAVNGKMEREDGPGEPVALNVAAQVVASDGKVNAQDCKMSARAGEEGALYLDASLTGSVRDVMGARNVDLAFSTNADLSRLAERFEPYARALAQFKPHGQITLSDGRFIGTPQQFQAGFKVTAAGLAFAGPLDVVPDKVRKALDILTKDETRVVCSIGVDLPKRRVEIGAFQVQSPAVKGEVTGTITDYAALKGSVDVKLWADTGRMGPVLRAMGLVSQDIPTDGSVQLAGRADTETGKAELDTLDVKTAYVNMKLKEKFSIAGLDLAKLKADPIAAVKSLSGSGAIEGRLFLDSLSKLPKGFVPPELRAGGDVAFTLEARQGSAARFTLSADAAGASLEYGDFFAKPKGQKLSMNLAAALPDTGEIAIAGLDVLLDGAEARLAGDLSKDGEVFTLRELTVKVTKPAMLAASVPMVKDLSGGFDLTGSGKVAVKKAMKGDLSGTDFDGLITFRDLHATPAATPQLALAVNGAVRVNPRSVDGGGLAITVTNLASRRTSALTIKDFRVTGVRETDPMLGQIRALRLNFAASSPELNVSDLMAALPKKTEGPAEPAAGGPGAPPPPDQPKAAPFDFLKGCQADGQVNIDKVTYEKYVAANVSAQFQMRDNKVMTPKPAHAEVFGGVADATLEADLNVPGIAHSGKVHLEKIDVNQAATQAIPVSDVFLGKTGGDFAWTGVGFSKQDIATSWTGQGEMTVTDGVVQNFDKFPLVGGIVGPLTAHAGGNLFPDNRFAYDPVNLKLGLKNGRLQVRDVMLRGKNGMGCTIPDGSVGLDGTVAFSLATYLPKEMLMGQVRKMVRQQIAVNVIEKAIDKNPPSFATFNVSGQASKPSITPDFTSFPKWVMSTAAGVLTDPGSLLDGFIKGKSNELTEPEQPVQPQPEDTKPKKKKSDDAIRGVLEGLIK